MDPRSRRDLLALQGTWLQVALEADGVVNPPDDEGPNGVVTTITDQRFVVHGADGELVLAGAFTLDATTTPKSITWIDSIGPDAGRQLPAIYELAADHFVFIAGDEGAPRPRAFATTAGQTMRTMRRVPSSRDG